LDLLVVVSDLVGVSGLVVSVLVVVSGLGAATLGRGEGGGWRRR
jgi:hypothetical protein